MEEYQNGISEMQKVVTAQPAANPPETGCSRVEGTTAPQSNPAAAVTGYQDAAGVPPIPPEQPAANTRPPAAPNGGICPVCGNVRTPGGRFCGICGAPYGSVAFVSPAQPTPGPQVQTPPVQIPSATWQISGKKLQNQWRAMPNLLPMIFLVLGLILFLVGLCYRVPADTFSFSSIHEYVGGDAYNGIIEAGIRGGKIAGAAAAKAVYICVGLLIACISAFHIKLVPAADADTGKES